MLNLDQFMNIRFLQRQGHSIREIARLSGHSRNTVRRLLRLTHPPRPTARKRDSKLDVYKPYLLERWQAYGLDAVRLLDEIRLQGFVGSVQTVRRFITELRADHRINKKLTVRFETPPGEQAQCDWAEVGHFPGPNETMVRIYAFVMVLSYSRFLYVEFTRSMRMETLIRCHQNAFAFFGGWPRRILYDNMRQVVIGANRTNERFLDFSRHYGFEAKRHRPYRPRTKGKVERSVQYLRESFLKGRTFTGIEDLNGRVRHWLGVVANVRVHATTGARPCDLLEHETLTPAAGQNPYQLAHSVVRTVSAEALVRYEKSDYSVPARWLGTKVSVDAGEASITIRCRDLIIAEHPKATGPGERVESPAHVKERWERSIAPPKPERLAGCHVTFTETVEVRPLTVYAEVAS
jgi:transposase